MRTTLTCSLCLALSLALAACGDDTGGTGDTTTTGPSSDPASTGDTSGGPSTSSTSGDDPTTGGDDNSASGTTTAPDTTTTASTTTTTADDTTSGSTSTPETTTSDTTTADDTTGGTMIGCGLEGPEVEATLVHDGFPPPPCGTFEFVGQNQVMDMGPVFHLDACPCDSDCFAPDPWTFTLDVPAEALPAVMPICPRIVVERQMGKQGCELVGVTILETQNQDWPFPYYVAGSLLGPPAAATPDLTVEQTVAESCECDFCCNSPERYDLEFAIEGDMLSLEEASSGQLGDPTDMHYDVFNFQSHYSGICDDSPAIDWVVSLQPAP